MARTEQAIISVPFNGRNPRNYRERKNRADVVHWPEAIRNGVVLKTRATVREITVDGKGLADGALYYDAEGKLHEMSASTRPQGTPPYAARALGPGIRSRPRLSTWLTFRPIRRRTRDCFLLLIEWR